VWKGDLSRDPAVFVDASGHDLVLADRGGVEFAEEGKVVIGKALKARFKIGDRQLKGTISAGEFEKYGAGKVAQQQLDTSSQGG
jgi:hypothetical protein